MSYRRSRPDIVGVDLVSGVTGRSGAEFRRVIDDLVVVKSFSIYRLRGGALSSVLLGFLSCLVR